MMFILFIVTMLVPSVKVKAESLEITNLLEQFFDLYGELPFAMTEEELRCVDGVLYDETSCCCTRRHSLIPVLRFQTTSAISGTLLLLAMNHWKRLLSRIHARSWVRMHSGSAQISRK